MQKASKSHRSRNIEKRCEWANINPLYIEYHDTEWGVPEHNDRKLFEFLILEGAQAGLSWLTILRKRENYQKAFDHFHPEKISMYENKKIEELLSNKGIVRNKLKISAAIQNAKAFLEIQNEFGSFDSYVWSFADGRPKKNAWKSIKDIPSRTGVSDAMSKDLKKRGFKFVGSTICYAFMQATGMVNDHIVDCFRYHEVS